LIGHGVQSHSIGNGAQNRKWGADRIVAEANQGGQMVEATIRTVDANVSFKAIHASRGKITRAEPIAALAEQHRIHVVGIAPELEDQLCTYEAGSPGSPDRLDAMVWAITELIIDRNLTTGFLDYYAAMAGERARGEEIASTVKMLAPHGIGAARLLPGRDVLVPVDRVVEMTSSDAWPLYRAGWVRAPAPAIENETSGDG
jgi:Terminase RNaseH-like domain